MPRIPDRVALKRFARSWAATMVASLALFAVSDAFGDFVGELGVSTVAQSLIVATTVGFLNRLQARIPLKKPESTS